MHGSGRVTFVHLLHIEFCVKTLNLGTVSVCLAWSSPLLRYCCCVDCLHCDLEYLVFCCVLSETGNWGSAELNYEVHRIAPSPSPSPPLLPPSSPLPPPLPQASKTSKEKVAPNAATWEAVSWKARFRASTSLKTPATYGARPSSMHLSREIEEYTHKHAYTFEHTHTHTSNTRTHTP